MTRFDLTEKEQQFMNAIPKDCFYQDGFDSILWSDCFYADTLPMDAKQARGVQASLVKKGFIGADTGKDATIWLLELGKQYLVEQKLVEPEDGRRAQAQVQEQVQETKTQSEATTPVEPKEHRRYKSITYRELKTALMKALSEAKKAQEDHSIHIIYGHEMRYDVLIEDARTIKVADLTEMDYIARYSPFGPNYRDSFHGLLDQAQGYGIIIDTSVSEVINTYKKKEEAQ